jgi:hypothetical protein
VSFASYATGLLINYEAYFRLQLDGLHREGRYRVFADLERMAVPFHALSITIRAAPVK